MLAKIQINKALWVKDQQKVSKMKTKISPLKDNVFKNNNNK